MAAGSARDCACGADDAGLSFELHGEWTPHRASRPRHAAIFAHTLEPGVVGRVERTRQLFGRVLPAPEEAERQRVRSDTLLD